MNKNNYDIMHPLWKAKIQTERGNHSVCYGLLTNATLQVNHLAVYFDS